jgi:hypothetical protein
LDKVSVNVVDQEYFEIVIVDESFRVNALEGVLHQLGVEKGPQQRVDEIVLNVNLELLSVRFERRKHCKILR